MTRQQIIEQLYNSDDFNKVVNSMQPDHLRQDLKQEVITVICELPEDKLLELHNRKELKFYTWRVITNMIQSSTSRFYKLYRQTFTELQDQPEQQPIEDNHEYNLEQIEAIIKKADSSQGVEWYYCNMLLAYIHHGTYEDAAKAIGIPKISVYLACKAAKKLINDTLAKHSNSVSIG